MKKYTHYRSCSSLNMNASKVQFLSKNDLLFIFYSLRAQFHVEESDINPLHGSASRSAARREIEKIFPVETTVAVIKPETAEENGGRDLRKTNSHCRKNQCLVHSYFFHLFLGPVDCSTLIYNC